MENIRSFKHSIHARWWLRAMRIITGMILCAVVLTGGAARASQPTAILDAALADEPPMPAMSIDESSRQLVYEALRRFHGPDLEGKDGPFQKLGFSLAFLSVVYEARQEDANSVSGMASLAEMVPNVSLAYRNQEPYVVVDTVTAVGTDADTLLADLEALGLESGELFGNVVSGAIPVSALDQIADLASLRFMRPALFETHEGAVTSQGDAAITADVMRTSYAVSGRGATVGVLSDSYDCLGTATDDVASGDLPAGVLVLAEDETCSRNKDEGRALMQIVHDVAPGAQQAFHTAYGGQAAFANGIVELATEAAADIIVDDVIYFSAPMFQDGIIAQAVDQVFAEGVAYFSSAGNYGSQSYESEFRASVDLLDLLAPGVMHDFDPGSDVDSYQEVTIPAGASVTFVLQWDQPYASAFGGAGSANDLDLLLLTDALQPIAFGIEKNIGNDPIEIVRFTNPGPSTTFNLSIVHLLGPTPDLVKYVYTNSDITIQEFATHSSTLYGHNNARGAEAVAASFFINSPAFSNTPPTPNSYSSMGPTPILFDANDNRIEEVRTKPELMAPDGVNTTFFGKDSSSDTDSFPNFFGTSAAAPHAAGVAALLREADPELAPAGIYAALEETGYRGPVQSASVAQTLGFIQAQEAAETVTTHDIEVVHQVSSVNVLPGQPLTFTTTLINQGPSQARNVRILDTYPARLTAFHLQEATIDLHPMSTDEANSIGFQIESLAVDGSSRIITAGVVDATINQDVRVSNKIVVESAGDTAADNNTQQVSIQIRVPQISFASPSYSIDEDAMIVTMHPKNPYAAARADLVVRRLANDTLEEVLRTRITIPTGQSTVAIPLETLQVEPDELTSTWTLALGNPNGAALGSQAQATLSAPATGDTVLDTDSDGRPDADEDINRNGDLTDDDSDQDGIADFIDSDDNTPLQTDEQPTPSQDSDTQSPTQTESLSFLYLPLIQ